MIAIHCTGGVIHHVAADNVARITVAGPSSQWHGVKAIVRLFDGAVLESTDSADWIALQVKAASIKEPTP